MIKVVTAEEMQLIEDEAARGGLSIGDLMARAGRAVADEALALLQHGKPAHVVVLCGKGNNGGDGFVAAGHLAEKGVAVRLFMVAPRAELKGEARLAYSALRESSLEETILSAGTLPALKAALAGGPLVIDALFGFGFKGRLRPPLDEVVQLVNAASGPGLAVDVPSGVEATTGRVAGPAVKATRTVTFTSAKMGLLTGVGKQLAGEISVADIGIPRQVVESFGCVEVPDRTEIRALLPNRPSDAHKKSVGRLLVVAGSVGMTGAAVLTAEAGLRAGAGLVVLAVPEGRSDIVEQKLTEVITVPVAETPDGSLGEAAYDQIMTGASESDATILGPGLSQNKETGRVIRKLTADIRGPLLIDADGLNALVGHADVLSDREAPTVVTPHPGELGRLMEKETAAIQDDRAGACLEAASSWKATVVLKGSGTIIAEDARAVLNRTGTAALATAGTGDVLAGVIGGLVAQGLGVGDASILGAYLHGLAGDLGARDLSDYSLVAGDLNRYLPQAFKKLIAVG